MKGRTMRPTRTLPALALVFISTLRLSLSPLRPSSFLGGVGLLNSEGAVRQPQRSANCTHWNVVAANSAPPAATAIGAASQSDWCTVIVADEQTPEDYVELAGIEQHHNASIVHFLSLADQKRWARDAKGAMGRFLSAVPYEHIARKNVGYLYAILHGAKWLRDLDEYHFSSKDAASGMMLHNGTHLEGANVVMLGPNAFNYQNLNGLAMAGDAPRGFPRDLVRNPANGGMYAYNGATVPLESVAVMQLWNSTDAAQRMPPGPLLVPEHAFVPYDARATMHSERALWALFLPSTVPSQASDIWRSYFAQALFRDVGLQVAVLPHPMEGGPKEHGGADLDSYSETRAAKLIEFMSSWRGTGETVPERMKELWVALNEHGFIESKDVDAVQSWLQALAEVGYAFPELGQPERIDNVVLLGQVNSDLRDIMFWTQKYRRWFNRIVVRGPFDDAMLRQLREHGITAHAARPDRGWTSPMENLMLTLNEYANNSDVVGVLQVHDDALLNVRRHLYQTLVEGRDVMVTHYGNLDPRSQQMSKHAFLLQEDGTYRLMNGTSVKTMQELFASLATVADWKKHWGNDCIPQLWNVYRDPESAKYHEADGSFLVAGKGQSDFMYVPTRYSEEFEKAAQLMVEHNVFLECGFPKITDILRVSANATIRKASLCTSWDKETRGKLEMIQRCGFEKSAMYHPVKFADWKYLQWSDAFDAVK